MPALILTPRLSRDSRVLEDAARSLGWDVRRGYAFENSMPEPTVFGDIAFCDVIAENLDLGLLETPDDWLSNLPQEYTKREIRLIEHKDLPSIKSRSFFKPANDKVFMAGIFANGSLVPYRQILPTAPVLVSEIVEFDIEVRCYVLHREVQTAAIYACLNDNTTADVEAILVEDAVSFTNKVLADESVPLPSAIVVDVGRSNQGWSVIEANQAYASGVYSGGYVAREGGADPNQVLQVIQRSAQPMRLVSPEDRHFLRPRRSA